jgi:hypothetical protein
MGRNTNQVMSILLAQQRRDYQGQTKEYIASKDEEWPPTPKDSVNNCPVNIPMIKVKDRQIVLGRGMPKWVHKP